MNSNRERETSLSERTLSGLGCPTFIKALLTLPVLVILARLLTPVDFGLLALAWIFILLGAIAGQSVVGPAIVQRYALTDRHSQVGFTLSVASGIAVMPIIWLLAPLVGEFFNEVHGSARGQVAQCTNTSVWLLWPHLHVCIVRPDPVCLLFNRDTPCPCCSFAVCA